MTSFFLASASLWQREVVRFLRQRSRIIGALGPPVLFWFLIGSGLGRSFQEVAVSCGAGGSPDYLQYFFPGTIALIILFTSIFSTISIIEDRHEGFLQSVLVAPFSREGLVLGKLLGGTTLAFVQACLFLCLAPVAGLQLSWMALPLLLANLILVSWGLTALGFLLAWRLDSTQGFHAIMNLFLIPMWLLSGALFPISGAPVWLRGIMRANPLSYGVSALQTSFMVDGHSLSSGIASPLNCLLISAIFAVVMSGLCLIEVRRRK